MKQITFEKYVKLQDIMKEVDMKTLNSYNYLTHWMLFPAGVSEFTITKNRLQILNRLWGEIIQHYKYKTINVILSNPNKTREIRKKIENLVKFRYEYKY